ncbi:MAG: tetratricopeptide repeat protein [Desulfuromonadales bacterium]|jgi:tetratricopeptide (TPR) repeat protein
MIRRFFILLLAGLFCSGATTATVVAADQVNAGRISTDAPRELLDLFYGEVLFLAFQEDWFDAISRLDTELGQVYQLDQPELDSLYTHLYQAEFALGDFELAYRMHHRAGRALKAVIDSNVSEPVRNQALYRLARIFFQKDQPVNALHAIERIQGDMPEELELEVAFLQAQIFMAIGRNADAVQILEKLVDDEELEGFASYNLGIALLRDGHQQAGRLYLDLTGQVENDLPATLAIKDKANLVLGYKLLEENDPVAAQQALERVRLDGVFSNRALLGWGWANTARGQYDRALVPWTILAERQVTDASVQEALLALPYSYGKLERYGKAAMLYGHALETFSNEVDRLSNSIKSIRKGRFLEVLVRPELQQDASWVIRLRDLVDTPETYYLIELMASHDFQEALKNYVDLEELRKRLVSWERDLDAFEQLIETRRNYYEPLLPMIDKTFRELDSQMRLRQEQREHIAKKLKAMLSAPRPDFLATASERLITMQLNLIEHQSSLDGRPLPQLIENRIKRLRGVLTWQIHTDYDRRLTETYHHLHALNADMARLENQYASFVRSRQAATLSYQGYDETIRRQRQLIRAAKDEVGTLMARQGHLLEVMAVSELESRRDRLNAFIVKTRFALADSYDRAARIQGMERIEQ